MANRGISAASLLFLLVWIVALHVASVLIFSNGYVLKRSFISNASDCRWEEPVQQRRHTDGKKECWMQRKFDRIAVVLIDAMRADFGIYEPHLPPAQTPFYKNKLPVIHELLTSGEGLDAHMFRFVADSPTTTTQRLKGLTTGSLPTFIDAGENFAAQSVVEDNWIKRANENGLVSVMLGDNTLLYLYPGLFDRQFGFYSFDVADLHSVDNGILQNLYSELEKSDWNVLVAHFLGVDHAGHR